LNLLLSVSDVFKGKDIESKLIEYHRTNGKIEETLENETLLKVKT
jgi:hypothetical protein